MTKCACFIVTQYQYKRKKWNRNDQMANIG